MKKTVITLAVAAATLFAFSSCEKENLTNTSNNGVRVITATFENDGTRTTLNADGKTPEWAVGDVLRILNGTSYQDVTLAAENITDNKITFTTTLTGTLYAVYPASATAMTSCSDGNVSFTIPAIQDGSFASANICVAKSSTTDETNIVFRNATAVLKIITVTNVVGVDVTTANSIAGAVTASFSGSELSLTTTSLDKNYVSAVGTSAPSDNVFYLAAAPVTTGKVRVNCYRTDMKGTTSRESKELARNVIYSMKLTSLSISNSNLTGQRGILNGHEYVLIKAKYDGSNDSYRKWATMNIGATTVTGTTSYGDYFMWGAVEKAYTSLSGTTFTFGSKPSSYINSTWNAANGFAWDNCNFTDGVYDDISKKKVLNVFTKYTTDNAYAKSGTADGKKVLEPADDVAAHMWGSTWRMPTGGKQVGEFVALQAATYWAWDGTDCGYYVFQPFQGTKGSAGEHGEIKTTDDKSKALLFFPFAGYVKDNSLILAGSDCCFWSSTLSTSSSAYGPYFDNDASFNIGNNENPRCLGRPVRPVSD